MIYIERGRAFLQGEDSWMSTPLNVFPITHICNKLKLKDVGETINENTIKEDEPCPHCSEKVPDLILLASKLGVT